MKFLVAASFLFLGAAVLDDGIVRQFDVKVDGKHAGLLKQGKAFEFDCSHAEGRKHTIELLPAKYFHYKANGLEFPEDGSPRGNECRRPQ